MAAPRRQAMNHDLWTFAGLMVLGQFSPGPDMLLLTRTAMREGRGAALRMVAGIACGLMVHATLAVTGVAVLLVRFPRVWQGLQWLAAGYLLWLAYGLLRSCFRGNASGSGACDSVGAATRRSAWVRGLFCNLLNAKVALFLAAVCAPFLATCPGAGRAAALWLIIVVLGFLLWSLWVLLLQRPGIRRFAMSGARWIDGGFGLALLALALRLLVQ